VQNRVMPQECSVKMMLGVMAVLAVLVSMPAMAADDAALRRCRAIGDDKSRLACFDALVPLPGAAAAPPPRIASAAAPEAVPMPAPSPAAPPPAAVRGSSFGLEKPAAPEAESIASTIPGSFDGWAPRQRIRLANGQVWQVADDSTGVYDLRDPKVTIKRGLLGGFVMEIEGARRVLRVRRLE
jgi:hypothetical protein